MPFLSKLFFILSIVAQEIKFCWQFTTRATFIQRHRTVIQLVNVCSLYMICSSVVEIGICTSVATTMLISKDLATYNRIVSDFKSQIFVFFFKQAPCPGPCGLKLWLSHHLIFKKKQYYDFYNLII